LQKILFLGVFLEKNSIKCGYLATYILIDKKKAKLLIKKGKLKVVLKIPLKREAAKLMNNIEAFKVFDISKEMVEIEVKIKEE